jgi:hypothetical protein
MKKCNYCGNVFEENFFEVANTVKGKVYRRNKCKFCKQNDKNNRILVKRDYLNSVKSNLKCVKCGNQDYRVIDFHHLNQNEKEFNVGDMVEMSLDKIKKEISKCITLCSNCHRIYHWEENNIGK